MICLTQVRWQSQFTYIIIFKNLVHSGQNSDAQYFHKVIKQYNKVSDFKSYFMYIF